MKQSPEVWVIMIQPESLDQKRFVQLCLTHIAIGFFLFASPVLITPDGMYNNGSHSITVWRRLWSTYTSPYLTLISPCNPPLDQAVLPGWYSKVSYACRREDYILYMYDYICYILCGSGSFDMFFSSKRCSQTRISMISRMTITPQTACGPLVIHKLKYLVLTDISLIYLR